MDGIDKFLSGVFCGVLLVVISLLCLGNPVHDLKIEAVKAGAAEWTVDADGNTGFRWKTTNAAQPQEQE